MSSARDIWLKYDAMEARLSEPLSALMVSRAALRPGMQVLDLACGRGEPALSAALAVGREGRVIAVDLDAEMLPFGAARAAQADVQIDWRQGDIQSLDCVPERQFHACFMRWALMYLPRPLEALRAAHQRLNREAPLVFAVWGDPDNIPFFSLPRDALRDIEPHCTLSDPYARGGVSAYARSERILDDLLSCGFDDIVIEDVSVDVLEAEDSASLLDWFRHFGGGRLTAHLSEPQRAQWEAQLLARAAPFWNHDRYLIGGTSRLVSARKQA